MSIIDTLKGGKALAVVGLGYVGLPLALAFAKKVRTIGFDINEKKLKTYEQGIDPTKEAGDDAVRRRRWNSPQTRQLWDRRPSSSLPCRRRLRKMTCPI